MNWFELGIQKYWAPTSAISKETKRLKLEQAIESNNYLWSEKYDGNFLRGIITPDRNALQTRGVSVKTQTYCEVQTKVLFWDAVVNAFNRGETVLLGEGYIPGGIDATVGSVLRCLDKKAIERQKEQAIEWRIFDVLALDGVSFLDKPIEERIKYIPEVIHRINHPLVKEVKFYPMDEDFFDQIGEIFAKGGEGAVCYKKGVLYTPGKRSSAWTTIKVKQEITSDIDCLLLSTVPCEKSYHGKEIDHWQFWLNTRTGERVLGDYFSAYQLGESYEPITKNYFYNYCGAITVGVYDKHNNIIELCKVSGLTDEFKEELRDNFKKWYLCPLTISGMMISTAHATTDGAGISIRHPILKSIRQESISPEDCTLAKIINENY